MSFAALRSFRPILPNGESYPATVVGKDIVTDIAILKIDADGLPVCDSVRYE